MIETSEFRGAGAIFGLVLAGVRDDYWNAAEESHAFRTAKLFLDGEKCTHWICALCDHRDESGWERKWCKVPHAFFDAWAPSNPCMFCGHELSGHVEYEFDWGAWRDIVIGSLGMEVRGFVKAVKTGRV